MVAEEIESPAPAEAEPVDTRPPLVHIESDEEWVSTMARIYDVRREFRGGNSVTSLLEKAADGTLMTMGWFQEPELQSLYLKLGRVCDLTWQGSIRRRDFHAFLAAIGQLVLEERAAALEHKKQGHIIP